MNILDNSNNGVVSDRVSSQQYHIALANGDMIAEVDTMVEAIPSVSLLPAATRSSESAVSLPNVATDSTILATANLFDVASISKPSAVSLPNVAKDQTLNVIYPK